MHILRFKKIFKWHMPYATSICWKYLPIFSICMPLIFVLHVVWVLARLGSIYFIHNNQKACIPDEGLYSEALLCVQQMDNPHPVNTIEYYNIQIQWFYRNLDIFVIFVWGVRILYPWYSLMRNNVHVNNT